jgi:hypothetical protein
MQPVTVDSVVAAWLCRLSSAETPRPSVVAFNIGLFETEDGFSAYLAGAKRYDPNDGSWASDEAFTPRERYVALPLRRDEVEWQRILELVAEAARGFLGPAMARTASSQRRRQSRWALTTGISYA